MAKGATPSEVSTVLANKIRQAIIKSLNDSAVLVWSTARILAPVGKSGLLQNSIKFEVDENKLTAKVFTNLNYAPHVEYMTRPHIILPKEKKALAWGKAVGVTKGGDTKREFVRKAVHHPGSQASPFMRPALDSNRENIKRIFAKNINSIR